MKKSTVMWMSIVAATALLVISASGCKKKIANPLPESNAIAGWEKSTATRTFLPKDLWQYIDGDSEQYIQAGVVQTVTSDYKYKGELEATVDVYTFQSADGAKKIFANGQSTDAKPIAIGDAGIAYAQSIIFRKGAVLVRIISYSTAPHSQEALVAMAHGVEAKL